MRSLITVICLAVLAGCASYNYSGAVVRPGGWGGYGGGWGHNNVAVVNNHNFGGGYYHPGRW